VVVTKKKFRQELREKFTTLILSAFGLVAALAWNEAVTELFSTYFGERANIIAKFVYAIFVTVIVVVIVYIVNDILLRQEDQDKK
jgi:membrane protein YdbS with pleckstrin-like domain